MQLVFIYQPVRDLEAAVHFYAHTLRLQEAWRNGSHTVAFEAYDGGPHVVLSRTDLPPGPMYLVDDFDKWIEEHPDVPVLIPLSDMVLGPAAGFTGPGGHAFYIIDQRRIP